MGLDMLYARPLFAFNFPFQNSNIHKVSSQEIFTWELRNPTTNAGFYTVQQLKSSSRNSVTFSATLNTSLGNVTVPNVNLNGRQSKILVTDYTFGKQTLLYSSSDILTYGIFDVDVLVLYLEVGQVGEFALKTGDKSAVDEMAATGSSDVKTVVGEGLVTVSFTSFVLEESTNLRIGDLYSRSRANSSPIQRYFDLPARTENSLEILGPGNNNKPRFTTQRTNFRPWSLPRPKRFHLTRGRTRLR